MSAVMKRFSISIWVFALVLAVITSLPYLVGQLSTPAGWEYSGVAVLPTGTQFDVDSHLAKMWQGSRGEWNYHLLFTHEDHPGLPVVQSFYILLGAIARITPFSLPLVFHIARFVLTFGLVLAIWAFASHFFEKLSERWLATLFGTIAVGCSWFLLFISPSMAAEVGPIEFWLIDAFNLLGALYMPHFAAAIILQIVIVLSYEHWVREKHQRSFVSLTIALALEAIIQPYAVLLLLPLLALLTLYYVFSAKRLTFKRALLLVIPFGIHAGLVLYQYFVLNASPVWASFTAQNITMSPPVIYYLLGYLPFLIPIALGAKRLRAEANDRWWMPIVWVVLVVVLLYVPFPTQRRYLLGVQTPLGVLAAYGWSRAILTRFNAKRRPLATLLYFVIASIALVAIIAVNAIAFTRPEKNLAAFYQPDEANGFAWLREHATESDLVLTTFDQNGKGSGNRIVAATGLRVFIGHWIETANFQIKMSQIKQFYAPTTTDDWRRDFLKETHAAYIWYDESARQLGNWNPADVNYLKPVFTSNSVIIYQVN
ncbi:MAG: hypothetical protein GC179_14585 [Anaerolineaceae bacterium]|nr:hypothetical protein [Anaerolineaceae bacterium]